MSVTDLAWYVTDASVREQMLRLNKPEKTERHMTLFLLNKRTNDLVSDVLYSMDDAVSAMEVIQSHRQS